MKRTISVIHPSRGRADQAKATKERWFLRADGKFEYILSIDDDDDHKLSYLTSINSYTLVEPNKSAIEAINKAAKHATGKLLIVISDDFDCPEHWDTLLFEAIGDRTDFCAKTPDGHQDWLITIPIMDRKYYERFGYIYNPSYIHMYSDLEMTCVAWMLGKYIKLPIEFKHNHPAVTKQPLDETYIRNNRSWGQGKTLFKSRLKDNFGLRSEVKLPKDELFKQGIAV